MYRPSLVRTVVFRHGSFFLVLSVGCNSYHLKYIYSSHVLGLMVKNDRRLDVWC
jgi:hypothetical protein